MTETPARLDAFPTKTTRDWPAVAAAWISLAGLVLALVPKTSGLFGWPVAVLGLAAGASALILHRQGRAKAKWSAIIAVVLAAGGVAGCVYWSLALRPVNIRYDVRGDAPYVDLRYTEAYHDDGGIAAMNIGDTGFFPWTYDVHSVRRHATGELVATIPSGVAADKSVSCEVFIDAVRVKHAIAKGPRGVADCSGF
jgi:hypothetical protein